jgi:hypothetical protein
MPIVSAEPAPEAASSAPPTASSAAAPVAAPQPNASLVTCPMTAADDGLIDDGEDGDYRILDSGGRIGGWMAQHDDRGSVFVVPKPGPFVMDTGGALQSKKAAHAKGKVASGDGAVAFVNVLLKAGGFYDASKYVGLSFWAKSGDRKPTRVRFRASDVNTAAEGKICKVCWNDFGKTIELTPTWTLYTLSFAELTQLESAADPRPAHLTPDKLFALAWNAEPGSAFDFWIDQVSFVRCK